MCKVLRRAAARVPFWLVGLLGALIVLAATFLLSVPVNNLEDEISQDQDERIVLMRYFDRNWSSHQFGDLKHAQAIQHIALSLLVDSPEARGYLEEAAIVDLRGAIVSMAVATNHMVSMSALDQLEIDGLQDAFNDLRSNSMVEISNQLVESEQVRKINEKKSRSSGLRAWVVALNILGLFVIMLKDLPVWKGSGPPVDPPQR